MATLAAAGGGGGGAPSLAADRGCAGGLHALLFRAVRRIGLGWTI
jgi:hypothetical protein